MTACQRWVRRRQSWRHPGAERFDPSRFTVEPVTEAAAKGYVLDHHYSGTYPASSQRYGLFTDGTLVGVCVLGIPVQRATLTNVFPDLEPFRESLELSRFVLADEVPANAESWMLARVFEQAAARGVRGVVSFSDPVPRRVGGTLLFPGHLGIIYQASNAIYAGRGTARTVTVLPTGEVLNDRAKQKVRSQEQGHEYVERQLVALGARPLRPGERPAVWLADACEQVGAVKLRHPGCPRYCFTLGSRTQRRKVAVALPPGPYPKVLDPAA